MRDGLILVWQGRTRLRLLSMPVGFDLDRTIEALRGLNWPVPGVVGVVQEVRWLCNPWPEPLHRFLHPSDLLREGRVIKPLADRWFHLSSYLLAHWRNAEDVTPEDLDPVAKHWSKPVRRVKEVPEGGPWLQRLNNHLDIAGPTMLCSTAERTRRELLESRAVQDIIREVKEQPDTSAALLQEALEALPLPRDYQYQHPLSIGLLAILHILAETDEQKLCTLIQAMGDQGSMHIPVPCRYAQALLKEEQARSAS